MSPTFAYGRGGKRYRYYVSTSLQTGEPAGADGVHRLPGPQTEEYLSQQLARLLNVSGQGALDQLERADVHADSVTLTVAAEMDRQERVLHAIGQRLDEGEKAWKGEGDAGVRILLPVRLHMRGGRFWSLPAPGQVGRPKAHPDRVIIKALKLAHATLREHRASPLLNASEMRDAMAPASPYLKRVLTLAFLAPDLQVALLEGRQSPGSTLEALLEIEWPLGWEEQRASFRNGWSN